ncbi:hypothetical protein EAH89_17385 [Roseomonas nepalensis]|uniref:Uncharacterized protein n=1 Tax=Muricoccus nepalensis TaxID=1854500 RepID=A0A502FV77_9PROT|nr:glycosyl hydrolase 108 family protein [Roseomonas nepalensis]TPG53290.1 hypothetical protein EAH89_17385 [Roseomonas nepalensis]
MGAFVLGLLPQLIPVAAGLIARLFPGSTADQVAATVAGVVTKHAGGADEASIRAAAADPETANAILAQLAEIAARREAARDQAKLDEMKAVLADRASARQQTVALSGQGSVLAWGAPVVTAVLLSLFAVIILGGLQVDMDMRETVKTLTIAAATYWIGSSRGSAAKDERAAGAAQTPSVTVGAAENVNANPLPPPMAAPHAPPPERGLPLPPPAEVREPSPPGMEADDYNAAQLGEKPRIRRPAGSAASTSARFAACLPVILANEGGFADNPKDPGGATNRGITHRTLSAWRGTPVTTEDVRELTVEEASAIYQAQYWLVNRCDQMAAGVDLCVFDFAVNSGRAVKVIQEALGVKADGAVGPVTLAALAAPAPAEAIARICAARMAYLQTLDGWDDFGRSWTRRVDGVRQKALAMT